MPKFKVKNLRETIQTLESWGVNTICLDGYILDEIDLITTAISIERGIFHPFCWFSFLDAEQVADLEEFSEEGLKMALVVLELEK